MGNTGIVWAESWTVLDAAIVLTTGGTIFDESDVIDCSGKAAIMISIDTDYSDDPKVTGGLVISVLKNIDDTVYENVEVATPSFEMVFDQNGTVRKAFALDVSSFSKIKLRQDWNNTTGSSTSTTATAYKFGDIPVAS